MKLIRFCSLVALFIALSGCASAPQFVKPAPDKLVLGKSTSTDVLQSQSAQPVAQNEATLNGEKVKTISYSAGESPKFWGLLIERRYATYTLYNDTLVGSEFASTYSGESTEFNTDKIPSIEKGKTTRSEVIALLGQPSGEVLYPVVANKTDRALVYSYSWSRFAGILTTNNSNLLVVTLDANNVVTNISFKQNGKEKLQG